MMLLRTVPAVLASIVLGAHFLREGRLVVAVAVALAPLLLVSRRNWAVRTVQGILAAGVVVWLHTLVVLAALRRAEGMPSLRMSVILLAVALVTALAAVLLEPFAARPAPAPAPKKES